jgi:hypothetical protein
LEAHWNNRNVRVTALVLLRARDHHAIGGHENISRATLGAVAPSGRAIDRARSELEALGFAVSPRGALGLAITADVEHFEHVFDVGITVDESGAIHTTADGGALPVDALPEPLRRTVTSIEFESPPDFGPASFG